MGNDSSRLKGLVIDKSSVEANDFWTLYNAESPTTSNDDGRLLLSIFQGEAVVKGQLWVTQGPLERAIKNLMIYRHPYILKYVTTWEQGGQKHLATERVHPLTAVLSTQNAIQVCLGLRTILCSLIFLIEKAMARHLNICASSIYITDSGSWRLAGFEYVWKNKEVSRMLLDLAKAYRHQSAIDPCESQERNSDFIEQYAFATLCEEVLAKCSKNDATVTPHVQEFLEYCATHLKHKNAQMRPRLSAVLLHPYFNHEFVLIHSFLFELPLKSLQEKQDFFTGLIDRLRYFNEEVVGTQLAADLLSRMVLLDPTAQLCVTPYVLKTKTDHSAALFSNQAYVRHVMPHIKKMFRLRDAQIRLILLEYFMEYVRLLSKEELREWVLPHLHAGMNDTNDVLVAKTLRCLADLVPILGSATVIGGNRTRLFSDGRPQAAVPDSTAHWVEPRSITPVMGNSVDYMVSGSPLPDNVDLSGSFNSLPHVEDSEQLEMPPRLSPDGGEDDKSAITTDGLSELQQQSQNTQDFIATEANAISETVQELISETINNLSVTAEPPSMEASSAINTALSINGDDDEAWSDWETDELQRLNGDAVATNEFKHITTSKDAIAATLPLAAALPTSTNTNSDSSVNSGKVQSSNSTSSLNKRPPRINDDLNALDIVVQKSAIPRNEQSAEFDFFKDMEPVIENKQLLAGISNGHSLVAVNDKSDTAEEILIDSKRFAAVQMDMGDELSTAGDGWGMDDDVVASSWKE